MFFWKKETNTEPTPDEQFSVTVDSGASLVSSNDNEDGGGGGGGSGLEQPNTDEDETMLTTGRQRRQIPTLVCILVPMVVFMAGTFAAAALMPPSTHEDPEVPHTNHTNHTSFWTTPQKQKNYDNEKKLLLHDDPVAPTLLSIRDHIDGTLLNVRDNVLYRLLKHATFLWRDPYDGLAASIVKSSSPKRKAKAITIQSDNKDVGYGDSLTLTWSNNLDDENNEVLVNEEDVVALYCPAGEMDPKNFRDAATIAQVKATHTHHHHRDSDDESNTEQSNEWFIPSFPIVREESCEFILYARSTMDGAGSPKGNGQQQLLQEEEDNFNEQHHYTFVSTTGPISVTSNTSPTGIHISLTKDPSEMVMQYVTGDSGETVVEFVKKSDLTMMDRMANAEDIAEERRSRRLTLGKEASMVVSWTKIKGSSTTYVATDMCQEPASSTDAGNFVSPGYLHTVKVTGLEHDTDYVYRVGLGFGQGIKWNDKYYVFRSPPLVGSTSSSPEKPALTFVALADQGCEDSEFRHGMVARGGPQTGLTSASDVTKLISSMIDKETIHAVHQIGDLAYADGAAHVWDTYMNMIQEYASHVPVMVTVGNHEYDHTSRGDGAKDPSGVDATAGFQPDWGTGSFNSTGGECGVPISKRFAAPEGGNGVFWYSYNHSLVHTVMLSSEHNMTSGSDQYIWLEKDLAAVNRSITPWVVVEMHRPLYNKQVGVAWANLMVAEGMQNEVEDLLHTYQVDLVLSGHYHSYFRSCPGLYAHVCNNGGPTYITVGTGGAPLDSKATSMIPNQYTEHFDNENFGVGKASVFNATSMHWQFVAVGGNVTDEVWFTRGHGDHH